MSRKRKKEAEKMRKQAAELSALAQKRARRLGKEAAAYADQGKEWATPKFEAAYDWAAPKADAAYDWAAPKANKAWKSTVKATAPQIEKATAKVRPVVDDAYDKVSGDYLPRVQKAAHDAYVAAMKESKLGKKPGKAGKAAKGALTTPTKRRTGRKIFLWTAIGSAVAGVGYVLWRKSQPVEDPWAEEYWSETGGAQKSSAGARVAAAAGAAKDKATEVAGKVSETAKDKAAEAKHAIDEVRHAVEEQTEHVKAEAEQAAADAEHRAAEAVADAADKAGEAAGEVKEEAEGHKND